MKAPSLGVATALVSSTLAFAQIMPAKIGDTAKGKVLTNDKGLTLYTFDKDSSSKSACTGPCADLWLPLKATADAKSSGDWGVVARDDGSKQWAHKGKPLYTWSKDQKAGDITGDGVNGVWHLAKP